MNENITTLLGIIGCLGMILGSVWGHSLWLSGQFTALRNYFDKKVEQLEDNLLSKLEYHERHDDKRFSELNNELWEIRLRNAAVQGILVDNTKTKDRYGKAKENSQS